VMAQQRLAMAGVFGIDAIHTLQDANGARGQIVTMTYWRGDDVQSMLLDGFANDGSHTLYRLPNNMTTLTRSWLACLMLLLCIGLTSCATRAPSIGDDPTLARITDPKARRQLQLGNPTAAANIYSARASRTTDPEQRDDYLLVAAEILFDRAMLEPGMDKLADIPLTLANLELQQRRDIVQAKSLLFNSEPEQALEVLPNPLDVTSPLHRARIFETQAQSYRALQDPANELTARIGLEDQLNDADVIDKNHAQIWQLLTTQSLSTLRGMTTNVRGDTYQGWIELALAHAESGLDSRRRSSSLQRWTDLFPEHPATARFVEDLYTPNRFGGFTVAGESIDQIAVLLPLSAKNTEAVSGAIRDGLIAAYEQSREQRDTPVLRFYDVGDNPAYVRTAFQNALADGADAVIGPLRKQSVAAIVTQRQVPVPTITLNTIDTARSGDSMANIIQFGLAPEDEARSAASRAMALSLKNAVVLQADDSRGDREARAFQDAMFGYGGDVVHVAVLPKDQYDYSEQIRDALLITQSDQRFKRLSATIGEKLFFEPSIRNDVDVIFLAVTSEQARSVRPQLDFFHAAHVPRFGTSRLAAIDDNEKKNKDLNTIFYPDAPWVLRESLEKDPLRRQILASFPPAEGVYAKLYALGVDAFNLMINLDSLGDGKRLPGYTGDLELTADGRIQRYLDWAQYQEGVSVPVERIESEALQTIRSGSLN